jgi:hypothetical protein
VTENGRVCVTALPPIGTEGPSLVFSSRRGFLLLQRRPRGGVGARLCSSRAPFFMLAVARQSDDVLGIAVTHAWGAQRWAPYLPATGVTP